MALNRKKYTDICYDFIGEFNKIVGRMNSFNEQIKKSQEYDGKKQAGMMDYAHKILKQLESDTHLEVFSNSLKQFE